MSTGSSPSIPFDPREFLRVANALQAATAEAEWRTAVGRAYYGLFLLARDRLYPSPMPSRVIRRQMARGRLANIPIHQAVLEEVKRRSTSVGNQLQKLHELRIQADYYPRSNPQYADWHRNAQNAMSIATHILPRIRTI